MTATRTGCTLCRRWNQATEPLPGCPGDMRCVDRAACDQARYGTNRAGDPLAARGDSPIGRIMSTADQATARRQAITDIREHCERYRGNGRMPEAELLVPVNDILAILERHHV